MSSTEARALAFATLIGRGPRMWLRELGPGLITGAADDDPSGIVTYSQAGAAFGYSLGWSVILTLPFMVAVQEISARLGRVTGQGLAAALKRHSPRWVLVLMVGLLVVANVINLGADIGAMAAVTQLLFGGPQALYALAVAVVCASAEIWLAYKRYVKVLKWLTVSLLSYVALLFAAHVDWHAALVGALVPVLSMDRDGLTTVLAVLGTTISPYLLFWQAAEEAEDELNEPDPRPLREHPADARVQMERIGVDTWSGMVFSNLVALAMVVGSAATLHAHGVTNIASAADAASALRPIAGPFAQILFALGIFGTGLLAIPTLAGSSAYAVGEALNWTVGLSRRAIEARSFYAFIAGATLVGAVIVVSPIDPIQALFW
ncbi:MAG TPA: divalent metal cation transporter [Acetobacteraceae bacterium]|jgi:NRAMP (natural resistance-associated macrophage protein)-like metal ion transporter|nr:divalent metal cation transporter [Acetobacteraceae bacterium]